MRVFKLIHQAHSSKCYDASKPFLDSSGRTVHARDGSDYSSNNISSRNTSSGEYTIRSASLATSSDEREPISLLQDEEPDTRAEERGEPPAPGASVDDLLRWRNLQHIAPMLDNLGAEVPSDLRLVHVEDLMEAGVSCVEAIKLLQGYPSSGAIRPFYPSTSELRALSVKTHGRFGKTMARQACAARSV